MAITVTVDEWAVFVWTAKLLASALACLIIRSGVIQRGVRLTISLLRAEASALLFVARYVIDWVCLKTEYGAQPFVKLETGFVNMGDKVFYRCPTDLSLYSVVPKTAVLEGGQFRIKDFGFQAVSSGKVAESALYGSEPIQTRTMWPAEIVFVYSLQEKGWHYIGCGWREGRFLITAAHVLTASVGAPVCFSKDGKQRFVPRYGFALHFAKESYEKCTGYDVGAFEMCMSDWSLQGAHSVKPSIYSATAMARIEIFGRDYDNVLRAGVGNLLPANDKQKRTGIVPHTASTMKGFSGSPVLAFGPSGTKIVGVHIAGDSACMENYMASIHEVHYLRRKLGLIPEPELICEVSPGMKQVQYDRHEEEDDSDAESDKVVLMTDLDKANKHGGTFGFYDSHREPECALDASPSVASVPATPSVWLGPRVEEESACPVSVGAAKPKQSAATWAARALAPVPEASEVDSEDPSPAVDALPTPPAPGPEPELEDVTHLHPPAAPGLEEVLEGVMAEPDEYVSDSSADLGDLAAEPAGLKRIKAKMPAGIGRFLGMTAFAGAVIVSAPGKCIQFDSEWLRCEPAHLKAASEADYHEMMAHPSFARYKEYMGAARVTAASEARTLQGVDGRDLARLFGEGVSNRAKRSALRRLPQKFIDAVGSLGLDLKKYTSWVMPPSSPEAMEHSLGLQLRKSCSPCWPEETRKQFDVKAGPEYESFINEVAKYPANKFDAFKNIHSKITKFVLGLDGDKSAGWSQHFLPGTKRNWQTTEGLALASYLTRCRLLLRLAVGPETMALMRPSQLVEAGLADPRVLFIKDEPHGQDKADTGRWRLIWGGVFGGCLHGERYL